MGRVLLFAAMLLQAPTWLPAQRSADPSRDAPSHRISMDVELVVLDVSVVDRKGRYVEGLDESNFQVRDEGELQEIKLFRSEDAPVTVGLIVDSSSSMRQKRAETARAAQVFVENSNDDDELVVVNFNENVYLSTPSHGLFSANAEEIRKALDSAPVGGQTALYDAIIAALDQLRRGRHRRKALLVFSDGGDNASRHDLEDVVTRLQESGVTVYTLGLFDARDPDRNPGVLKKLAKTTGGRAFLPGQMGPVAGICEQIAEEVRARYTIGYTPSQKGADGSFRNVDVRVRVPGKRRVLARTRAGYRIPISREAAVTP